MSGDEGSGQGERRTLPFSAEQLAYLQENVRPPTRADVRETREENEAGRRERERSRSPIGSRPGELGNEPTPGSLEHLPVFENSPSRDTTHQLHLGMVTSPMVEGDPSSAWVSFSALPGFPAVPQKVTKKILAGEYVDMAELRPDSWRMDELMYHSTTNCPSTRQWAGKRPVTDILTWLECYSVLSAVITAKNPERATQLFAYQRTIVKASQLFEGPAWVSYDSQFRRKAALPKSWDWGNTDTALYNECFTGRAKVKPHCRLCFSDTHLERSCPLSNQYDNSQGFGGGSAVVGYASQRRPGSTSASSLGPGRSVELCGKFNKFSGNECKYGDCRFAHICSLCCFGPHPASRCTTRQRNCPQALLPSPM